MTITGWRLCKAPAGAVLCAFMLAATVLAGQTPAAVERPTLAALLARAGEYATGSLRRLATVVSEERYVLNATYLSSDLSSSLEADVDSDRRELKSRFTVVTAEGGLGFRVERELFEADGRAITLSSGGAANDGGRYALGGVLHDPLEALTLLQPVHQSDFRMTLRGRDPAMGVNVWVVDYRERPRPTIFQQSVRDPEASGHFWIEWDTGLVRKTELVIGNAHHVVTSFRVDETLQIGVPVQMRDSYSGQYSGWISAQGHWSSRAVHVEGVATYGQFGKVDADSTKGGRPK
jgi:hypothetical protein